MNIPPLEAERALIGAVLVSPGIFLQAGVSPGDFGSFAHRAIWGALTRCHDKGVTPDPVAIHDELGREAQASGGLSYLSELLNACVTTTNAEYYARAVREAGLDRRIRKAVAEVQGQAKGSELLQALYAALSPLRSHGADDQAQTLAQATKDALKQIQAAADRKQRGGSGCTGITTGYKSLDEVLGGWQRGVVSVVAGRPSMGKSALALSCSRFANAAGYGVYYVSAEDVASRTAARAIAQEGRLELNRLRTGALVKGDLDALNFAAGRLYQTQQFLMDDSPGISATQIATRVFRAQQKHDISLVVVDYVNYIRAEGSSPREKIDSIMTALCDLAKEANVAVMLLAQLNRQCEIEKRRPRMADLKESGGLEEKAYAVVFVHRPEQYASSSEEKERLAGKAELLVKKNKDGQTGLVPMHFSAECVRFDEIDDRR